MSNEKSRTGSAIKVAGTTEPCGLLEHYSRCENCPKYVNGYPENKLLKLCFDGKCFLALSTVDDNLSPPEDYINNKDRSNPWVVLNQYDFLVWLIKDQSE